MTNGVMRLRLRYGLWIIVCTSLFSSICIVTPEAFAQGAELQAKIAEVKQAAARNRQALAQYTWQEQVTISIKGEQKKQEHFQVHLGPDGKPQKTSLDSPPLSDMEASSGRAGRLKERIVEKKKEEYKEYADQIKSLIQQYVPPQKEMLERALQQGNITVGSDAGLEQYRLIISNYIKPGDRLTLVIDKAHRDLSSLSIATYLVEPKDTVKASAQFATLPDGPNHVASQTINGESKQLTIAVQNSSYQKL